MIALSRFIKWFSNIERSGFAVFQKAVRTLKNYLYGIMNYFYYRLTNAGSKGFKNKINVIKRKAYGTRIWSISR